MKTARAFAIVLVTAPDLKTARRLARLALEARLAACVNLVPRIESHYWWRGKLEKSREILLVIKTLRSKIATLEKLVLQSHPYDTPEIVTLPLEGATPRYLAWLQSSLEPGP